MIIKENKWISVKDKPEPEEDGIYKCKGYWLDSGTPQIEDNVYFFGEWDIVNNFILTHWMKKGEIKMKNNDLEQFISKLEDILDENLDKGNSGFYFRSINRIKDLESTSSEFSTDAVLVSIAYKVVIRNELANCAYSRFMDITNELEIVFEDIIDCQKSSISDNKADIKIKEGAVISKADINKLDELVKKINFFITNEHIMRDLVNEFNNLDPHCKDPNLAVCKFAGIKDEY